METETYSQWYFPPWCFVSPSWLSSLTGYTFEIGPYEKTNYPPSVCAASIIRVSVFHEIKVKDITYTQVNTATWSCVEQSLGIICACLPTMRPLLGRILHTTKRSGGSDTKESHARSRPVTIELGTKKLGWNGSANDGDSTVGFARLPEEYPTPGLSQPPGYPLNGATAISTTVAPVSQDPSLDLAPQTIVKKQEIEQRSYAV